MVPTSPTDHITIKLNTCTMFINGALKDPNYIKFDIEIPDTFIIHIIIRGNEKVPGPFFNFPQYVLGIYIFHCRLYIHILLS